MGMTEVTMAKTRKLPVSKTPPVLTWVADKGLGQWGGYECKQEDFVLESRGPGRGFVLLEAYTFEQIHVGTKTACMLAAEKCHQQRLTPVLQALEETTPCPVQKDAKRHWLHNQYGWAFLYEVRETTVVIHRSYRGAILRCLTLPLDKARHHYRQSLDQGFTTPEGNL